MDTKDMDTFSLACLMARSGHYKNWYQIELHLRFAGIEETRKNIGGFYARRYLNKLCNEARSAEQGTYDAKNKRAG